MNYLESMPSLKGMTVAITGASRGRGFVHERANAAPQFPHQPPRSRPASQAPFTSTRPKSKFKTLSRPSYR